jgi:hypothetical protein
MPCWHARSARIGLLILLALAITWMRLHTYAEPRERDLDIYAWIGHYLLQGRSLYIDLVDIKPPLPYLLYALAERLVGFGAPEVFLLGIASAWATLFGLYWLGARAFGQPWLGLAAATCWVFLGSDLYLQANQPNTEVFINAFMVWGVALLWALPKDRVDGLRCIGIGVLFGCASLCKTVALVPAALLLLAQLTLAGGDGAVRALKQIALVVAAIAALWLVMFAWLALQGAAAIGWQILVDYPAEYARINGEGPIGNVLTAFGRRFMPDFFVVQAWLVLACAVAMLFQRNRDVSIRMLAWAVGIFVAVALPGQDSAHYFQLWLPWLCLALALSFEWIAAAARNGRSVAANGLLLAFAAVWCAFRLWPQYRLDANQWSLAKYKGTFVNTQALGLRLGAQLQPTQRLFVFGVFPGLYDAAGREPESGVLNLWLALPHYGGSLSPALSSRVLAELRSEPPDLIVLDAFTCAVARAHPGESPEPISEWIKENYRMVNDRFNYSIAVRAAPEAQEGPAKDPCPATRP